MADYQNHGEMLKNVPPGTTPTHVDSKFFLIPQMILIITPFGEPLKTGGPLALALSFLSFFFF